MNRVLNVRGNSTDQDVFAICVATVGSMTQQHRYSSSVQQSNVRRSRIVALLTLVLASIPILAPQPAGAQTAALTLDKSVRVTDTSTSTSTSTIYLPDGELDFSFFFFYLYELTYDFTVTNTGSETISNVSVLDTGMSGLLSPLSCSPLAPATLAPGDSMTCYATYAYRVQETDAGAMINTASAEGMDPTGAPVSATDDHTVVFNQPAGMSLTKSASSDTFAAGDEVTYTFQVQNTGWNRSLSGVSVTDTGIDGLSALSCSPAAPAVLTTGQKMTCTGTKTMTQDDVDAGALLNTASASGLPSGAAEPLSATADETITPSAVPEITLDKSASPMTYETGDVITYTMVATNTGGVSLEGVEITDTGLAGLSDLSCSPAAPATLAPAEQMTCTAELTATQDHTDAMSIANTASAFGQSVSDGTEVTDTDTETVTTSAVPGLSLTKTADADSYVVGETIGYTFVVTNTGGFTLPRVSVTDTAVEGLSDLVCAPAAPADLAPDQQMTCTAELVATQAHADAGTIVNTATASDAPYGNTPPNTATASETVTVQGPNGGTTSTTTSTTSTTSTTVPDTTTTSTTTRPRPAAKIALDKRAALVVRGDQHRRDRSHRCCSRG